MKHLLFATDFSIASENSFLYTEQLIKGRNVKLHIIHVYDIPLAYSTQTPAKVMQAYIEELKTSSTNRMIELMERISPHNRGDIHPIYGVYPSIEIVDTATLIKADLIIMALRKDYGFLRRFMGNTTVGTIQNSSRPVMAIPAKAKFREINKILFPTAVKIEKELSDSGNKSIQWISKISSFLNTPEIELIHINEEKERDATNETKDNKLFESLKLNYSYAMTVEDGIYNYMTEKKPDLLTLFKSHRSYWERLYQPAKTRHLLYSSNVPLILL